MAVEFCNSLIIAKPFFPLPDKENLHPNCAEEWAASLALLWCG